MILLPLALPINPPADARGLDAEESGRSDGGGASELIDKILPF